MFFMEFEEKRLTVSHLLAIAFGHKQLSSSGSKLQQSQDYKTTRVLHKSNYGLAGGTRDGKGTERHPHDWDIMVKRSQRALTIESGPRLNKFKW